MRKLGRSARRLAVISARSDREPARLCKERESGLTPQPETGRLHRGGATLASVWPGEKSNESTIGNVRRAFYFGDERTPTQDLEYSIDQLVEVAVRALSPVINDPFIAITCIDWLGDALIRLAGRELPSGWRYDEEGRLRIIVKTADFAAIAASALNQIRQYGSKKRRRRASFAGDSGESSAASSTRHRSRSPAGARAQGPRRRLRAGAE